MARRRGLPPGGRRTSSDRITITITTEEDGRKVRRSHSKVKPDEPRTYATEREAWDGYYRIQEYLAHKVERGVTLGEFWEAWTDPDHWRWGKLARRGESSLAKYRSATRAFVMAHYKGVRNYDAPIEAITPAHIEAHMERGGTRSSLITLSTMFNDAIETGVRSSHPCRKLARKAAQMSEEQRESNRRRPPDPAQIDAILARATEPGYPRSFWGWLNVGTETGMRGGEIDALSWEYLDGNRYHIVEQWNASLRRFSQPKFGSRRVLLFDDDLMEIIESFRGEHPRFVLANPRGEQWRQDTRDYWWTWMRDGGPSLVSLAEGRTMKECTRHFWAWRAVNVWGISPYQAAQLYGHKDHGKTLTKHYVMPDHERALMDVLARKRAAVVDLSAVRRRKEAGG